MREQIQISLKVAAAFFLLWSLALISDPISTHKLISTGPLDNVTHGMLAGSFLGFAILLLLGSDDPRDDFTGALATMMLILGAVSAFSMAGNHDMPTNVYTVTSLIFTIGVGAFLLVGQMQELYSGSGSGKARPAAKKKPAPKAKKKPARKKAVKKKVTRKKAKKKRR
ncbi:MAG: hypothetical protein ACC641_02685 [Acidiferrobacterales bacterium]